MYEEESKIGRKLIAESLRESASSQELHPGCILRCGFSGAAEHLQSLVLV